MVNDERLVWIDNQIMNNARQAEIAGELGRRVESGQCNLGDLEAYIVPKGDAARNISGRQEMLENMINEFI